MKICMNCGNEIDQLSHRVKFCSGKCKQQYHDKTRNSEYRDISVCCANCKKEFIKRTKKHSINYNVFCSDECKKQYKINNAHVQICPICNKEFAKTRSSHLCCSRKCAEKYKNLSLKKICLQCGKEYISASQDNFCSDLCREKHRSQTYGKTNCKYCGSVFIKKNKGHIFCSSLCKQRYMIENDEEIVLTCSNCGKEFNRKCQYIENKDKYFCSHKCAGEYNSLLYRNNILERMKKGEIKTQLTSPHIKISEILNKNEISHVNEYVTGKYCSDIYIEEYNLIIEIMGSYWHSDTRRYPNDDALNQAQINNVNRDRAKDEYYKKLRYNVLYLWEKDINDDICFCEQLILDTIKKIKEQNIISIHSSHILDNGCYQRIEKLYN